MDFRKERLNLEEALEIVGFQYNEGVEPWIIYDNNVEHQYHIIREHVCDGTMLFACQLMDEAIYPLLYRTTYWKPSPPPEGHYPVYTIGEIKVASVYGKVKLPCGVYPGFRRRIKIPVRVDWKKG